MPGTFTKLLYHLVFSTKQRLQLIDSSFKAELFAYIAGIVTTEGGVPLAIGGVADHVHLLVKLKPTTALSDTLRVIKTNSSKWVNDRPENRARFGWQDGYSAFSVSESQLSVVREYILNQETHHQHADFKSELISLLKKHGVEYDERYIWQ